jgi:hypothetical protein
MIECLPRKLGYDTRGAFRTRWHYRTDHKLEDIEASGDEYWIPVSYQLRPGDIIEVEDHEFAWWYEIFVIDANPHAETRAEKVVTEIRNPVKTRDPERLIERDLKAEAERLAAEERQREMELARDEAAERQAEHERKSAERNAEEFSEKDAEIERRANALELRPVVKWRGPHHKFAVLAYDVTVSKGYEFKESAHAALDNGDIAEEIAEARAAWISNNKVN